MKVQLLLVIAIGISVGAFLLWKLYRFFFSRKAPPRCGGCTLCDDAPGRRDGFTPQRKRR